jgi:hypothetical protein
MDDYDYDLWKLRQDYIFDNVYGVTMLICCVINLFGGGATFAGHIISGVAQAVFGVFAGLFFYRGHLTLQKYLRQKFPHRPIERPNQPECHTCETPNAEL